MKNKSFTEEEIKRLKKLGLACLKNKHSSGFNYYPQSIESRFEDSINIPLKYTHGMETFVKLLINEVKKEFKDHAKSDVFPKTLIYIWFKFYNFPKPDYHIKIYDVDQDKYLKTESEYKKASDNLIAEGSEFSILFTPLNVNIVTLVDFIMEKGSYYQLDNSGYPLDNPLYKPDEHEKQEPYLKNPKRINDDAFKIPMVTTKYDSQLEEALKGFRKVKKLCLIRGESEISTYLDKTYDRFIKNCQIKFQDPKLRLANNYFVNVINFED